VFNTAVVGGKGRTKKMDFINQISGRYGSDYEMGLRQIARRIAKENVAVLEFGAGESTGIWAEEFSGLAPLIISVDHEKDYLKRVAESLPDANVQFRWFDLEGPKESQSDQHLTYSTYQYGLNRYFDLIFIDGRRRLECALVSSFSATDDTLVVIHDHARSRYALMRDLYQDEEVFGQFLILRRPKLKRRIPSEPKERRAIVQVVSSPSIRIEHSITRPLVEAYAQRIGARYVTVELPDTMPPAAAKFAARPAFDDYDRVCLLDVDVVVSPDSPDIFELCPSTMIGAWREDQAFVEESRLMNQEQRIIEQSHRPALREHINSGVLVLPREHYDLLDFPQGDCFFGHPLHENSHVNSRIFDEGRPFYCLPYDMNFIPAPATFLDQRFGWFIHIAGAGKSVFRHEVVWTSQGTAFGKDWLTRVKLLGRHTRIPRLRAAVARVQGRSTIAVDPDDVHYFSPSCIVIANGAAHIFVPSDADELEKRAYGPHVPVLRTYGPYASVASGAYRLSFDWDAELANPDSTVMFDIVGAVGTVVLAPIQPLPLSESFEFSVPQDIGDLEIRLYAGHAPVRIRGMLIEAQADVSSVAASIVGNATSEIPADDAQTVPISQYYDTPA
jgi:hypothetical protein